MSQRNMVNILHTSAVDYPQNYLCLWPHEQVAISMLWIAVKSNTEFLIEIIICI